MNGLTDSDRHEIVWGVVNSASNCFERIKCRGEEAASEYDRPHVIMRPALSIDGNQWCALYGTNLQDGVAGFGASPYEAMTNFDRAWYAKLPTPPAETKDKACRDEG